MKVLESQQQVPYLPVDRSVIQRALRACWGVRVSHIDACCTRYVWLGAASKRGRQVH